MAIRSGRGVAWICAVLLGAWSLAAPAAGQAPDRARFEVTVLHLQPGAGEVDPRAKRFDRLLQSQVRYGALEVMETRNFTLAPGEIGRVDLATGSEFRFQPIDVGKKSVLIAVDWKGTARGDFRVRQGKPLFLGGQAYRGGQVAVIVEAR